MNYGISKKVDLNFEETIERVKSELKKEGFGILTEIDVKKTLKEKLDIDYGNYLILGACNPPFAYKALQAEKEIGLLLPCNVIVYVENGNTFISAINPSEAMGMISNGKLREISEEIGEKLKKVVGNL